MDPAEYFPIPIDNLPATGGRLVATFTYPEPERHSRIQEKISDVKDEIGDVKHDIGDVTHDIADVRTELSAVHNDIGAIRNEVTEVRLEVGEILGEIRSELSRPPTDLTDIREALDAFANELVHQRAHLSTLRGEIETMRGEVRDVAVEFRVQKRTAATLAWAMGATVVIALAVLLVLGWSVRQSIDRQMRAALDTQQRSADAAAQSLAAAKVSIEEQVAASRELYRLTLRELDRFGAIDPQLQSRVIATLAVNTAFDDADTPEIDTYFAEREQKVISLLRPRNSERLTARRPIEAVVRLHSPADQTTALLMVLRRPGADALNCHVYFKAVDGLNKLQCPGVEAGRYQLSVAAFLNSDAGKNPRPAYTVETSVVVEETPMRQASLPRP
jgi:archaellum component FlaC